MNHAWVVWLFAWSIVIAILYLICLVQERPVGKNIRQSLGWLGCFCIGVAVLGVLFLVAFGLL